MNQQEIINKVQDSLWSASCELMTLAMATQGEKANRLSEISGQLQALQLEIQNLGFVAGD